jgi:aromatic ring-cleaving dioxygenase
MPYPLHIDEEHNKAIRAEVGERLRIFLWMAGRQKVPNHIRQSIDRLDVKRKTSPSIVPWENEGWLRRLLPRRFR